MIEAKQFGAALALAKIGHRIARKGWNGKGMFVFRVSSWTFTDGRNDNRLCLPFLAMKTADDKVVPWLASQTDLLASDWIDLDESEEPVVAEIANLRATIERSEAAHRAELSRAQGLLDDVAHAHERDILAIWKALGAAVVAERARCAARVRDEAHRRDGLKSTPTLRAVAAALDNVLRGIESGDTGAGTEATRDEVDYLDALLARHHTILTGVANALRGDPGATASHSHHDLAERAAAMVAERDAALADAAALRAAAVAYLAAKHAEQCEVASYMESPDDGLASFNAAGAVLTASRDALRAAIGGAP
jgi:hypothetical protein